MARFRVTQFNNINTQFWWIWHNFATYEHHTRKSKCTYIYSFIYGNRWLWLVVYDVGPALAKHWVDVSCLLGSSGLVKPLLWYTADSPTVEDCPEWKVAFRWWLSKFLTDFSNFFKQYNVIDSWRPSVNPLTSFLLIVKMANFWNRTLENIRANSLRNCTR